MARETQKKAVIYCRVSSAKQTTRGDGLASQETRCREYAKYRGHDIVKVFKDDMSGSVVGRPGMMAMLAFLKTQRKNPHVVIIDDISRLARGLDAHLKLRAEINGAGGILESPSIEFGEDSDSQLVEHLLASVSQHQRQKNGEQTLNRMRARVMNGFWVFPAPIGYRFDRAPGGGKMLVPAEPMASVIREALEGFASGRFQSKAEVGRFLQAEPTFPTVGRGNISDRVEDILTQPLYAGHLAVPRWKIGLRKAQHEGLISFDTFNTNQMRLSGGYRVATRADINEDFPLRGFVLCDDCGHPLTANWSKGAFKSYPYYLCRERSCESKGKSIARAAIEGSFEQLLHRLTPARELYDLASAVFRDLWDKQALRAQDRAKASKTQIAELDRKLGLLLDRIVESESRTVVAALENRVEELEREKLAIADSAASKGTPIRGYDETFRTALSFLASPWNLWKSDRLEDKRAVLKLTFANHLRYHRKEGFRTPETSLPFSMLGEFLGLKGEMAHPERFERPTLRFVV